MNESRIHYIKSINSLGSTGMKRRRRQSVSRGFQMEHIAPSSIRSEIEEEEEEEEEEGN
jgi:hypothetical protein